MADYSLRIHIDAQDRASAALGNVRRALGNLGLNLEVLGHVALGGLGVVGGAAAAAGVAVGGATVVAGRAIAKFTREAAGLEGVSASFAGIAESAGVSADEMLAALQKSTGGMITQRDLMLSFNRAAQLVSPTFAVQLPEAMGYLSKIATASGQDMNYMMNSLVLGIGRMSPLILDNLGVQVSLAEATERAAEMFGVKAEKLTEAQKQAGLMAVVMEKLRENTAAMPDTTDTAAAKMARLRTRLQDTAMEIGDLFVPTLDKLLTMMEPIIDTVLPVVIGLLEQSIPIVESIASAFGVFTTTLMQTGDPLEAIRAALAGFPELRDVFDKIVEGLQSFWETIQPVLQPVWEWLSANIELKDILTALGIVIGVALVGALKALVVVAAPLIGTFLLLVGVVALIRQAWESDFLGIRTLVETTLANIRAWWAEHGDAVLAKARALWEGVKAAFQGFVDAFRPLYEAFRAGFEGDWHQFGVKLREFWDESWERLKSIVKGAFDWFKSVDWGEVGRAIIEGIANGIRAAAGWLAEAARNAARAALDAAKGFLGIRSPSRLFETAVGEQMMAGWIRGIEKLTPRLEAATLGAAGGALGGAQRVMYTTNNYYLTVTSGRSAESVAQDFWLMRWAQ